MIIKHIGTKTVKDEKTGKDKKVPVENDISHLVNNSTWSFSVNQKLLGSLPT